MEEVMTEEKEQEFRTVKYLCKYCSHKWELNYPIQSVPPLKVKCPVCNRLDDYLKPYNFFKDSQYKSKR